MSNPIVMCIRVLSSTLNGGKLRELCVLTFPCRNHTNSYVELYKLKKLTLAASYAGADDFF